MIVRPPIYTRTVTLFPYTTLVRSFRDAAVNRDQGASREKAQQAIVAALGDGLQRMAQGQIDYRIETPFPPAFEKLRTDYNDAVAQLRQIMLSVAESEIGRAHVCTLVTNAHIVCRLLLEKKTN